MAEALELENIYLRQGSFLSKDINLTLEENETVALIGKSGAGKSTLIRVIGNAATADSGIIRYFGKEMYEDEKKIRVQMTIIFEDSNINTEKSGLRLAKEIKR